MGQVMTAVGMTIVEEQMQESVRLMWPARRFEHPGARRSTDYPRSTGKPPTLTGIAAMYDMVRSEYALKTLWRCNGYRKVQNGEHVWIRSPWRGVTAPGHGNAVRRRLGQRATWYAPPPHLQPPNYDEPSYVWFNADGSRAPASMPWEKSP